MPASRLFKKQTIRQPLSSVWAFFSDPRNLKDLTPPEMHLHVTSGDLPDHIYPGQIITYTLKPLAGIPVGWMTEITQVEKEKFFVDEQRSGPYAIWHHEHHFKEINGGVEMTDIVHYKLPFGLLGKIAGQSFINRQLEYIFEYRRRKIDQIFHSQQ
ncbi:MAG: hypothetical protein EOP49_00200 [Sphingobacteriales bacterium]|nr:MAG: hypothetical protein EOP49_00200 [Sphingobacteriales bacterium]